MKNLKQKFIKLEASNRLYGLSKPIVAITGGIATGKSTATQILRSKGYAVIDADQLVKKIYSEANTLSFINDLCPEVIESQSINFQKLRKLFFSNPKIKEKLEAFIYQKIPELFLLESKKFQDMSFIFYDVPLLFEKKLENFFDLVILIYAPESTQLERLVLRDKCSSKDAKNILSNQISIEDKKRMSDLIISNTEDLKNLEHKINLILEQILKDND